MLEFQPLKGKTDSELIELHDKNVNQTGNKSFRESPELIRFELHRREIKRGNNWLIFLTVVITILTTILTIDTILNWFK